MGKHDSTEKGGGGGLVQSAAPVAGENLTRCTRGGKSDPGGKEKSGTGKMDAAKRCRHLHEGMQTMAAREEKRACPKSRPAIKHLFSRGLGGATPSIKEKEYKSAGEGRSA